MFGHVYFVQKNQRDSRICTTPVIVFYVVDSFIVLVQLRCFSIYTFLFGSIWILILCNPFIYSRPWENNT